MKRHLQLFILFPAFFTLSISAQTVHQIQVANYSFTPDSIANVKIGDIIEWDWVSGSHTATSVSIPSNAASFNYALNSTNKVVQYTVTVAGKYNYVCTPHASMGMVGTFIVDNANSISSIVLNEMSLEPNPAHDFVNIKLPGSLATHTKLNVFDLLGRKVLTNEIEINTGDAIYTLDINSLKEGVYLVTVSSGGIAGKPLRMIKR
jgi:plastocyanin